MFKLFKKSKRDPVSELRAIIGDYELPSFPTTVMNVLDLLRDPDSTIKDISDQIEMDPGLHVKVLSTVNSAAFGLAMRVSNVAHAVSLLGRSRLESIVLSVAIKNALPDSKTPCFDGKHFWKASMIRASMARLLAQRLHPSMTAEAFSAGLLQDMAMPVMADVKKEKYCEILKEWNRDSNIDICDLEKENFGIDHTTVGSLLAEKWKLPEYLIESIRGHHDEGSQVMPAVKMVSLIRYSVNDDALKPFKETCIAETGMDETSVSEMIETAIKVADELGL
jgi:HD-like signal output (HDOD) protein